MTSVGDASRSNGEVANKIQQTWRFKHQRWLVGGIPTPLKKYEFVSWDDDISNIWKKKIHVPNHQPDQRWSLK
jgi:hypothetical protein